MQLRSRVSRRCRSKGGWGTKQGARRMSMVIAVRLRRWALKDVILVSSRQISDHWPLTTLRFCPRMGHRRTMTEGRAHLFDGVGRRVEDMSVSGFIGRCANRKSSPTYAPFANMPPWIRGIPLSSHAQTGKARDGNGRREATGRPLLQAESPSRSAISLPALTGSRAMQYLTWRSTSSESPYDERSWSDFPDSSDVENPDSTPLCRYRKPKNTRSNASGQPEMPGPQLLPFPLHGLQVWLAESPRRSVCI
jgi:hypothetical protein